MDNWANNWMDEWADMHAKKGAKEKSCLFLRERKIKIRIKKDAKEKREASFYKDLKEKRGLMTIFFFHKSQEWPRIES